MQKKNGKTRTIEETDSYCDICEEPRGDTCCTPWASISYSTCTREGEWDRYDICGECFDEKLKPILKI